MTVLCRHGDMFSHLDIVWHKAEGVIVRKSDLTLLIEAAMLFVNDCMNRADGKFNAPQLPENEAQLKHIFRKEVGHLEDSPENRQLLTDLAADRSKCDGIDRHGNWWHSKILQDNSQVWVEHRDGLIRNGGVNKKPKKWTYNHGMNNFNPFRRR